jgi:hypothetical protein
MTYRNLIVLFLLLLQTIYCWCCFYAAKDLPYDENYGMLIHALIVSLVAWVALRVIKARWFGPVRVWPVIFWVWVVVGSPLIFLLFFFYYSDFFGSLQT